MSYEAGTTTRFKTGETCTVSGGYEFDAYTDGSRSPAPKPEEQKIPVSRGEKFPPIRSTSKACWWRLVKRL